MPWAVLLAIFRTSGEVNRKVEGDYHSLPDMEQDNDPSSFNIEDQAFYEYPYTVSEQASTVAMPMTAPYAPPVYLGLLDPDDNTPLQYVSSMVSENSMTLHGRW